MSLGMKIVCRHKMLHTEYNISKHPIIMRRMYPKLGKFISLWKVLGLVHTLLFLKCENHEYNWMDPLLFTIVKLQAKTIMMFGNSDFINSSEYL